MKAGGRAVTADRSRFGMRRALVILQVALSLVLLTGALLFGRSLRNLTTLDAGLNGEDLMIARVDTSKANYVPERRNAVYESMANRLRAIPGVEKAASAVIVQLSGSGWNPPIEVVGVPSPKERVNTWFDRVSPGYFATVGTPLIAGRDFNERDTASAPEVAIVTEMFQQKLLNGENALGKQVRILAGPGEDPHLYEIVGVVKNSKYISLSRAIEPLVFVAQAQDKHPGRGMSFLIRSKQAPGPLTATVKSALMEENADLLILLDWHMAASNGHGFALERATCSAKTGPVAPMPLEASEAYEILARLRDESGDAPAGKGGSARGQDNPAEALRQVTQ